MADEVQQLIDGNPFPIKNDDEGYGVAFSNFFNLGLGGNAIPGWWSPARDRKLADYWKTSDALKIGVNTFISKSIAIPLHVTAKNPAVQSHVDTANSMYKALMENSGMFKGFSHVFSQFLQDWLTQDNGAFALVLGGGPADGPIIGSASGIIHLESGRCVRTKSPEFPIVYHHRDDGKRYKIHYSRLIEMVNLPSTDYEMNGVGHCPVTLCLDASQELLNMTVFAQEKLGSRPARQILYAEEGAVLDQLEKAVQHWNNKMDQEGLHRFAKTLLLAPKTPGAKLKLNTLDLASVPDGFNRQNDTVLAMAIVAAAFGLDLRDLAHSFGISGQTRSDAEVQDRKGRGKGVGQFIETFARLLTQRFLPDFLEATFDYLDDAQDESKANIRSLRATARTKDMVSGALTERAVHQQMLDDGELTDLQFEEIELESGRLPDGNSVLSLFYSSDPLCKELLTIPGVSDPLASTDDPEASIEAIRPNLIKAWQMFESSTGEIRRRKIRRAIVALEFLEDTLNEVLEQVNMAEQQMQEAQMKMKPGDKDGEDKPGTSVSMGTTEEVGNKPQAPFGIGSKEKKGPSLMYQASGCSIRSMASRKKRSKKQ